MRPTNSKTGTYVIQGAKKSPDGFLLLTLKRVTERADLPSTLQIALNSKEDSLLRQRIRARNPHGMAVFLGTKLRVTLGSDDRTVAEILPIMTMTDAVRDVVKKEIIQTQAQ